MIKSREAFTLESREEGKQCLPWKTWEGKRCLRNYVGADDGISLPFQE